MPILGVIDSGKSGHLVTNNYSSISTVTVGSGGASSITFSSLPSTYTHLQIRMFVQETRSDYGIAGGLMTFNSDTGSNYTYHKLQSNGSIVYADNGTSQSSTWFSDGNFGTNQGPGGLTFGVGILDVLDYANTNKYKTTRCLTGVDLNGTVLSVGGRVGLFSGLWMNTSAITSLTITPESATNFRQYSSFALYGVK